MPTSQSTSCCRLTSTHGDPQEPHPRKKQRSIARKQRDLQDTYLTKMGFPDSVALVDSGNGVHDYRRTRLPNDDATAFRLNALYNCLARKFGTPDVISTRVYDPQPN